MLDDEIATNDNIAYSGNVVALSSDVHVCTASADAIGIAAITTFSVAAIASIIVSFLSSNFFTNFL